MVRFALGLFLIVGSAFASDVTVTCYPFGKPLVGGFCTHIPKDSRNLDLVYYLHGRGNNEKTWNETNYYPEQIRQQWKRTREDFPTVVSISFGGVWLLAEKNASDMSGLWEVFLKQIMPIVEKAVGGVKGKRVLVGESMGGFNSAQLALKTSLFARAAILCAPMSEVSPFASDAEIQSWIEKSSAWKVYKDSAPDNVKSTVDGIIQLSKAFYPTQADWDRANPIILARNANADAAPRFYVAAGFYDPYLTYEGNQAFYKALLAKGVNVDWRPQWGGHCSMDIPSLARFIVM